MNAKKMTAVIARMQAEARNTRDVGLGYERARPGCIEAAVAKRCAETLQLAASQVAEAAEIVVEVVTLKDGALFCSTTPRMDDETVKTLRAFFDTKGMSKP